VIEPGFTFGNQLTAWIGHGRNSDQLPAAVRSDRASEFCRRFPKSVCPCLGACLGDIREALHTLAEQLPEGATWKDVAYEAYVRQKIEAGLEEARRGEFATDDEVKSAFAKWGVQVETEVDTPSA